MLRRGAAAIVSAATTRTRTAGGFSNNSRSTPFAPLAAFTRSIASTSALHFPRTTRAIDLTYKDGACTLAVPLPLAGFDEERVFRIAPEATVASIVAQIEAEDASVQRVDIRSKRGKSFPPTATLETILKDDFELCVNDRVLPVTAPVFAGTSYVSLVDEGDLDVRAVTQKAAVIALRHTLETLGKWKITYAEYEQLCKDRGITKKQAPELLTALHQAGVVLAFRNSTDEDLQQSIFLQPRSVVDSYLASLNLSPVSTQLFTVERDALLRKIRALEPEHVALSNLERELAATATRYADVVSFGLSTSLVATFGLYFWLSFIHFSWDIMEPVTYFSGFGMSVVGYAWWSVTNQEYEYANIYDYCYKKRLATLHQRAHFDKVRLQKVRETLKEDAAQLKRIDDALSASTQLQSSHLHVLDTYASGWDDCEGEAMSHAQGMMTAAMVGKSMASK